MEYIHKKEIISRTKKTFVKSCRFLVKPKNGAE